MYMLCSGRSYPITVYRDEMGPAASPLNSSTYRPVRIEFCSNLIESQRVGNGYTKPADAGKRVLQPFSLVALGFRGQFTATFGLVENSICDIALS